MIAQTLTWHRARPKLAIGVHALFCSLLIGIALVAQYAFGHQPCELCLWQRIPYVVIFVIALAAMLKNKKWTPWILLLIAVLYAVETGLALHHVGVEQHWWNSAAGCGFQKTAQDIKEMYEQIKTAPIIACDQPRWFFLGLSMAMWNAALAALLVLFSLAQAWVQRVWWTSRRSE